MKGSSPKLSLASRWRAIGRDYGSVDPRSLGLFRIALGTLLFLDAARRYPDIENHYANSGWLPNHFMLFRPMSDYLFSLYLTCSTPGQVKVLLSLQLLVDALLVVGFRTKTMHILAAILLASLNSRNVMIENGGWVVLTLVTVWSMFLPLGRRFSVDALLCSFHETRECTIDDLNLPLLRDDNPVCSLAVFALVWQWLAIYAFNALQKNGLTWRDGSALYYALHQHTVVTPLGAWLADALPIAVIHVLSFGAVANEALIALLLACPIKTHITRMVAAVLVCALHLSIASVLHLGTFSWAMIIPFLALIPRKAWDRLRAELERRRSERQLLMPNSSPLSVFLCRVLKRFDNLHKIRFLAPERETSGRLAVVDPKHGRRVRGLRGLLSLGSALPLGPVTVAWCALPGIAKLTRRAIRQLEQKPSYWSSYFELAPSSPGGDESTISPARAGVRRFGSLLGEATVLVLLVCCGSELLIENQAVPASLKPSSRPAWMTAVVVYPRLFEGWSMFAPEPPLDDVVLVIDGRTKDGRHFDPLTGREPSFELSAHPSRSCEWYYFDHRLSDDAYRQYLPGVRDFLKRHHEITGRPQDALLAFDVWSVSQAITLPGVPKISPSRNLIFSYGTVDN